MIIATWSGGIDSTAVLGNLLQQGRDVHAVSLGIYEYQQPKMWQRERTARELLMPTMEQIAENKNCSFTYSEHPAEWIWAFSPDGVEIPNRNRHIIDHLITQHCMPSGCKDIAMGEYIGADSWVVQDHVDAMDADTRSLSSYLLLQWGLAYRLWTLADFGTSRFKHHRMSQLIEAIGEDAAQLTTNCLHNTDRHCGECYKCVERFVAFGMCMVEDKTEYETLPQNDSKVSEYLKQMAEQIGI